VSESFVQEEESNLVLLVAFMNADALRRTLVTGQAWFWSRSRQQLWHKGETSGHYLYISRILVNCEANSLLLFVRQEGPGVCHAGYRSCYYRQVNVDSSVTLIDNPVFDPEEVYGTDSEHSDPRDDVLIEQLRKLYAGYARLRDEDYTVVSRTSLLLHDGSIASDQFLSRARQEMAELEGVLDGTHVHSGILRDDALLESIQVNYWICLSACLQRLEYEQLQPHVPLLDGYHGRSISPSDSTSGISTLLYQLGTLLAQAEIHPLEPVTKDMAQLQQRLEER
jgi:phosphoribosyl-AMP cyclohydrolase